MTSKPASRRARATTFAPRSCPSSPGLATRMRTLRLPGPLCCDMPRLSSADERVSNRGFFEPLRVLEGAVELRARLESLEAALLRELSGPIEQRRPLRGLEGLEREGGGDRLVEDSHGVATGDDHGRRQAHGVVEALD